MTYTKRGAKTITIKVKVDTYEELANYKIIREEPFDSVIKRIIKENNDLKEGKIPIPVPEAIEKYKKPECKKDECE